MSPSLPSISVIDVLILGLEMGGNSQINKP
jgi:hypothetical protein